MEPFNVLSIVQLISTSTAALLMVNGLKPTIAVEADIYIVVRLHSLNLFIPLQVKSVDIVY